MFLHSVSQILVISYTYNLVIYIYFLHNAFSDFVDIDTETDIFLTYDYQFSLTYWSLFPFILTLAYFYEFSLFRLVQFSF